MPTVSNPLRSTHVKAHSNVSRSFRVPDSRCSPVRHMSPSPSATSRPSWLKILTRRVIAAFLERLTKARGWRTIYIVSPWISPFDIPGVINYAQFLKRVHDEDCTLYVVTRPPKEPWHQVALDGLRDSGCANIVLAEPIHTKLYWAQTDQGRFALLGSANLTQRSLDQNEIGLLLTDHGESAEIISRLKYEAAELYRSSPTRHVWCQRQFQRNRR